MSFSEATAEPAQPAAEEMLESPAEELVSESVAEVQESIERAGASAETADSVAETPVAEEPAPPVRSLFASRLRMPPPPRRKQAGDRRGFGGCRCAARGFLKVRSGIHAVDRAGICGQPAVGGNVDVFFAGILGRFVHDPFFGAAVKPLKPVAEEPPVARGGRKMRLTPNSRYSEEVDPNVEEMAGKLATIGARPFEEHAGFAAREQTGRGLPSARAAAPPGPGPDDGTAIFWLRGADCRRFFVGSSALCDPRGRPRRILLFICCPEATAFTGPTPSLKVQFVRSGIDRVCPPSLRHWGPLLPE